MALATMRSVFMNDSIVIVPCKSKVGYVYKFARKKGSEYRCCRCRELGKERYITVVDGAVKGRKDPEVDHHADCEPFPDSVVQAQQLDREMRADVRSTGKRSRKAFSEMMESVAKKCRTSDEQAEVVANLPSYSEVSGSHELSCARDVGLVSLYTVVYSSALTALRTRCMDVYARTLFLSIA